MPNLIAAALLGAGVGTVAGMFGVGGGFLLTPLLHVVFGVPIEVAAGTGLCLIVGTALGGYLRFRQLRYGEPRFDLLLLGGSIVGADAGVRALALLAGAGRWRGTPVVAVVIATIYIVILLGAAGLFWIQGGRPQSSAPLARVRLGPTLHLPRVAIDVSALLVAYIGLGLGFLSGLLGIGGGVALMPVLVYGFGFPIQQAAGTGIVMLYVVAVYGTVSHAVHGHVNLHLALALLVGATPSAQLGARLTARLPAARLRRAFAFVVLATAGAVAWNLGRQIW
jgi:uncharacterized membrane protein YfcA